MFPSLLATCEAEVYFLDNFIITCLQQPFTNRYTTFECSFITLFIMPLISYLNNTVLKHVSPIFHTLCNRLRCINEHLGLTLIYNQGITNNMVLSTTHIEDANFSDVCWLNELLG